MTATQTSMELKRVLGFTSNSRNSFVSQAGTGNLIYIAGCVVVILDPKHKTQRHLIGADGKQSLTTLAISDDGQYLAGADCGARAANLHVWRPSNLTLEQSFEIHNTSELSCMAFSPDNRLLVTFGSQSDMILSIWDWRRRLRLASHKMSTRIRAISFAADGSYFVTVGDAHVKFWQISLASSELDANATTISVSGRSAILGDQKRNSFCDVRCARGSSSSSTFCLTKSGLLCEINERRLLHKWVDLRTSSANCLDLGEHLIAIGCANGVTRCFNTSELRFIKNLPRPHTLGLAELTPSSPSSSYPSVLSVRVNEVTNSIACVYADRSIHVWELPTEPNRPVERKYSALYHSSCIWGLEMYSASPAGSSSINEDPLPPGSFITCSSDDTLRIWSPRVYSAKLGSQRAALDKSGAGNPDELIKIVFTDSTHKFLCDPDCSTGDQADSTILNKRFELNYDSNEGLRCLRLSPNGKHLAVGSRSGAIRIFDLTREAEEIRRIAAHDAEVLCLEYSDPQKFDGYCYLASSSRDKLIHILDASTDDYTFVQTIDDHLSCITALRFVNNRARDCLQLVSCGADQRIIFRNGIRRSSSTGGASEQSSESSDGSTKRQQLHFVSDQRIEGKVTFHDMEVDGDSSCLMTACQDRMIRLFDVAQGKHQSAFRGSASDEGSLIRMTLDPSCTFLAASSTNKTISIYDYQRGECIATISVGLSDLVTDLKFSPDGRHLVACSGDGCIFVWCSPAEVANAVVSNLGVAHLSSLSSCSLDSSLASRRASDDSRAQQSNKPVLVRLESPAWAKQPVLDEHDKSQLSYQATKVPPTSESSSENLASRSHKPLLSSRAKMFQSRENLDRISKRERFVADSLLTTESPSTQQPQSNVAPSASLSGKFNTRPPAKRIQRADGPQLTNGDPEATGESLNSSAVSEPVEQGPVELVEPVGQPDDDRLDLSKLDASTVPLTPQLCRKLVDELQNLSRCATRLHQRLLASEQRELIAMLSRGVQNSMNILSIVQSSRPTDRPLTSNLAGKPQTNNLSASQSSLMLSTPTGATGKRIGHQQQPLRRSAGSALTASQLGSRTTPRYLNDTRASELRAAANRADQMTRVASSQTLTNRPTNGKKVNIDQVLEAYSDRLYRMVQERMTDKWPAPQTARWTSTGDWSAQPSKLTSDT